MDFDPRRVEAAIVEILDPDLERVFGMGFRLLDDVIATACRCLPHAGGRVRLPDLDLRGADAVRVRVRRPATGETALATVLAADPCADFALLGGAEAAALVAGLARPPIEPRPFREGSVFVYTHEGRWIDASATSSTISVPNPKARIPTGTSGAPVVNRHGRVVGIVGYNDVRVPDATMCSLADRLPGWALRRIDAALHAV